MDDTDDVYADAAVQPDPPVNVQLHYPDGRSAPVELTFEGTDRAGIRHWVATPDQPTYTPMVRLTAEMLPPKTTIHLHLTPPPLKK